MADRPGYVLGVHIGWIALTANENRQLIAGIVSLGTGVLIFLVPRLLNYIVAAYLVVVGILLILNATD
jgi:amino acid permease